MEIHPYNSRTRLVDFSQSEGMLVNSYCPLGGRGNKGQVTDSLLKDPALQQIAASHERAVSQVIITYTLPTTHYV